VATTAADWVSLLAVLAVVYVAFGVVAFGPLMEER
jgi:hypothetical protein